ncbi:uncharacterized protein BN461_02181 [Bacteroides sp. CAG:1076]|nr:uncharacterized protein BN461_02181 [Bacteroides sp. CAG:1076]
MKNYVLIIVCMLCSTTAFAQYCSLQKGQKLYYEVLTGEKKIETYTSVVGVETKNDSTFITLGDFAPKMNEKMKDTLFYRKVAYANGNTLVYLQDGESMKNNMFGMMAAALNRNDMTAAKEKFDVSGQICLLLNERQRKGDKIKANEMSIRIKPVTMTVSMKGEYEGTETISTPAGQFDCVKVTYSMKMKFFMFSDESQITEWYAKGVGLVKQEEKGRKLGQKMVKTLTKIAE